MKKIIEYIILNAETAEILTGKVNKYIDDGWQLYASPYSAITNSSRFHCQAMVKYEEEKLIF